MTDGSPIRTLGLVIHPKRPIDLALDAIKAWAAEQGATVGQVAVDGQERKVADRVEASDCDMIVAVGGDGTALAALHAGARASRPALAISCGSIGALTTVTAERTEWALGEITAGRWTTRSLPALELKDDGPAPALNDIAVVRDGGGQVEVEISVGGDLYARVAGDGAIVATPTGSSAYSMAAGGPLLATTCEGFMVSPLSPHGGSIPPLVVGGDDRVQLAVDGGYGGMRMEMDGQRIEAPAGPYEISLRPDYATVVALAGDESSLAGLRRRRLVLDSPRAALRDDRS